MVAIDLVFYDYNEVVPLPLAGGFNLLLNRFRRLTQALVAQLVILHPGYHDVNVDAVEQWPRNAFLVFGDDARRTGTSFHRVTKVVAGAGV